MATLYPRKVEMDVTYVQPAPAAAAFRVTSEGFLQLKDSADEQFRSLFLTDGVLQVGPGEA